MISPHEKSLKETVLPNARELFLRLLRRLLGLGLGSFRAFVASLVDVGKLAAGAIRPLIHARLPLKDARRAHEMIEARQVIGKILLKP